MLSNLKNFFNSQKIVEQDTEENYEAACAALLCEAAYMDGSYDSKEKEIIVKLIKKQFNLNEEEALIIVNSGEQLSQESSQIYGFTRAIKQSWKLENRIKILEMLWEVAFADGRVDAFEKNLIQRVAGLTFVSDKDRVLARKRVMARLGIGG